MTNGTGPAVAGQDKLGQALRSLKSSSDVRLGLVAGAAALGITWLVTFIFGLIPFPLLGFTVLSPASEAGGPFNYRWWAVWSLLNHFGGSVRFSVGANASILEIGEGFYSFNITPLVPLAIFVGVMLLVGRYVRRMAPADVRARLMTVVATAVIMAAVVGLVALLGGYTIASEQLTPGEQGAAAGEFAYAVAFGAFSNALRAFVITFVVGAFAFGVVGLLPVPHAAALQNAARFAVLPALVVAVITPLALGAFGVTATKAQGDGGPGTRSAFMGAGSFISPAAGAAIVPTAFGAQATVGVAGADLSVIDKFAGDYVSGGDIAGAMKSFSGGRIFKYAGYLGAKGKFGAFVLVVAVLAFWVYVVRKYLQVMGAPTAIAGLKAGSYFGLVSGVAVGLLAFLLTLRVSAGASALTEGASIQLAAGITGFSYVYTLLVLIAAGAVVGYLVGALRPAPTRYTLSDLAGLARRAKAALPAQVTAAGQSATGAIQARVARRSPGAMAGAAGYGAAAAYAPAFCAACGAPFGTPQARFCAGCGAPRALLAAPMVAQSAPAPPPKAMPPPNARPAQRAPQAPRAFCGKCGTPFRSSAAGFCAGCGATRA